MRRTLFQLHLWLGLALMAPLIVVALTGSALVFREQIDEALNPQRYAISEGAPRPYADQLAAAQRAVGDGAVLTVVRPPLHEGAPLIIDARGSDGAPLRIWLDAARAEPLDVENQARSPLLLLHSIHASLLVPGVGVKIVSLFGLGLAFLAASGLWLWTPRRDFLKGFAWRRSPRTTSNLHHRIGVFAAPPILVVALTGFVLGTYDIGAALVRKLSPPPVETVEAAPQAPTSRRATLDEAIAAARAVSPDGTIVRIGVPADGAPWSISMRRPHGRAIDTISARNVGEAARVSETANPFETLSAWMYDIHAGAIGAPAWTAIVFLTGLAPFLLALTGLLMWLAGRRAKALGK